MSCRATSPSFPPCRNGRTVAVTCAIDNLTKGAAGGAVQWMNRMFGHEETAGLMTPAPGLDLTQSNPNLRRDT